MAISPATAQRVWAANGGRCAICRQDLISAGTEGHLGEIAHIVARKQDGPCGQESLPPEERDRLPNLVLLCPNDHRRVDKAELADWPASRLLSIKTKHEAWIREQLDQERLQPVRLSYQSLQEEQLAYWAGYPEKTWVYASVSPRNPTSEIIDPLDARCRSLLDDLELPRSFHMSPLGSKANPYHTEPSERGIVNENFAHLGEGLGYRVELFRTGFMESLFCLSFLVSRSRATMRESIEKGRFDRLGDHRLTKCTTPLFYRYLYEPIVAQVTALHQIWEALKINAHDLAATVALISPPGTALLTAGGYKADLGRPTESQILSYSFVLPASATADELVSTSIEHLVLKLGLVAKFPLTEVRAWTPPNPIAIPSVAAATFLASKSVRLPAAASRIESGLQEVALEVRLSPTKSH